MGKAGQALAALVPDRAGTLPAGPDGFSALEGLHYFGPLQALLAQLHSHKAHPNRDLHFDSYTCLLLLCYFNPVLRGLRQIEQISDLKAFQKALGIKHVSRGSFSEASHVFDPKLLAGIFTQLAEQAGAQDAPLRPAGIPEDLALLAVDGTLVDALSRMLWALWLEKHENAVKLHVHYDVLRGVPVFVEVTPGNGDERQSLRLHLAERHLYLMDRGYRDYKLYEEIIAHQSSFVSRLMGNAKLETIHARALTAADCQAGVVSDEVVWLGDEKTGTRMTKPVRVIHVRVKSPPSRNLKSRPLRVNGKVKIVRTHTEEFDALLVTDRMDLSAEVIALLYRYRWHVELFFSWFKITLGHKHLFAESPNGVLLQVYVALIASLLVVLWTGRKPNRYDYSMLTFYFSRWATLEELLRHLEKPRPGKA
jgi:hypothetical protein